MCAYDRQLQAARYVWERAQEHRTLRGSAVVAEAERTAVAHVAALYSGMAELQHKRTRRCGRPALSLRLKTFVARLSDTREPYLT